MQNTVFEFDIAIRVKPEMTWMGLVELTARSYLKARNYPPRLVDHTLAAIGEAMEQIIALCVNLDRSIDARCPS